MEEIVIPQIPRRQQLIVDFPREFFSASMNISVTPMTPLNVKIGWLESNRMPDFRKMSSLIPQELLPVPLGAG